MKKVFFIMLSALLTGGAVMAQTDGGPKFGIKAGVNLASQKASNNDVDETTQSRLSFHFFGYADIPVSNSFSIQPGIGLNGKGAKIDQTESVSFGGSSYTITANGTVDIMYIEVPVNAVFNFNGFYFGAGPYFGYAISGKQDYTVTETSTSPNATNSYSSNGKISFGNDPDVNDYNAIDYGVNVLVGYQLKNNITIGANYGLGLANIAPKNDDGTKGSNRVISFSLGYAF